MSKDERLVLKYCLQNAVFYNGKADTKAVLGKILANNPELRKDIFEIKKEIEKTVKQVNSLSLDEQKKTLKELEPSFLKKEVKKQDALPPLKNAVMGRVVTRFAPSPTGPLMITHLLRAVYLNYLYAKKYKGKFILRIEDTDPGKIEKRFYDWVKEDLERCGIKWDKLVLESEYMGLYYRYAEEMIEKSHVYACFCPAKKFRELKLRKQDCVCRDENPKNILKSFKHAKHGKYDEGEIVFRLKTSMQDPNPVLRDPPILRIIKKKHPLKRKKYFLWPLYNYACALLDHYLGVTHVFRGKEHEHNTTVQERIYQSLNWKIPVVINFGMIYLPGKKFHTRDIKEMIKNELVLGFDDPKLPTVRALLRRGFQPDAFKQCAISCGLTKTDITFSSDLLETINRRIIDKKANRYMVVTDPVKISIKKAPKTKMVKVPLHPDFKSRCDRSIPVNMKSIFISKDDFKGLKNKKFRLISLGNIKLRGNTGTYLGNEILKTMQKIQWVSKPNVKVKIIKPDGVLSGIGEVNFKKIKIGNIIQMERIGFGRIDRKGKEIVVMFAHK